MRSRQSSSRCCRPPTCCSPASVTGVLHSDSRCSLGRGRGRMVSCGALGQAGGLAQLCPPGAPATGSCRASSSPPPRGLDPASLVPSQGLPDGPAGLGGPLPGACPAPAPAPAPGWSSPGSHCCTSLGTEGAQGRGGYRGPRGAGLPPPSPVEPGQMLQPGIADVGVVGQVQLQQPLKAAQGTQPGIGDRVPARQRQVGQRQPCGGARL